VLSDDSERVSQREREDGDKKEEKDYCGSEKMSKILGEDTVNIDSSQID